MKQDKKKDIFSIIHIKTSMLRKQYHSKNCSSRGKTDKQKERKKKDTYMHKLKQRESRMA